MLFCFLDFRGLMFSSRVGVALLNNPPLEGRILLKRAEILFLCRLSVGREASGEEKRGFLHCVVSDNMVDLNMKK